MTEWYLLQLHAQGVFFFASLPGNCRLLGQKYAQITSKHILQNGYCTLHVAKLSPAIVLEIMNTTELIIQNW